MPEICPSSSCVLPRCCHAAWPLQLSISRRVLPAVQIPHALFSSMCNPECMCTSCVSSLKSCRPSVIASLLDGTQNRSHDGESWRHVGAAYTQNSCQPVIPASVRTWPVSFECSGWRESLCASWMGGTDTRLLHAEGLYVHAAFTGECCQSFRSSLPCPAPPVPHQISHCRWQVGLATDTYISRNIANRFGHASGKISSVCW